MKPLKKLRLVFITTKNTMANNKIVATSFQMRSCVDENIKEICEAEQGSGGPVYGDAHRHDRQQRKNNAKGQSFVGVNTS